MNVPIKVQAALDAFSSNKNFVAVAVIKDDLNNYTIHHNFTSVDDVTPKKYTKKEIKDTLDT